MTLDRAAVLEVRDLTDADTAAVSRKLAQLVAQGRKLIVVVGASCQRSRRDERDAVRLGVTADPHARAMVMTSGAVEASAALARALTLRGARVSRLDPRKVAPTTRGHTLDAEPRTVNGALYERALRTADIVLVPAGLGVDEYDRPTYLGDSGGRIAAVFLASSLALPLLVEATEPVTTGAEACSRASIGERKATLREARSSVRLEAVGSSDDAVALSA